MNKYRREVSIEILVGLFMFTVLIALGIFTIVLSKEKLWEDSYQYEFVFSEVGGLREGDNVFLRGMNIGRVKQTTLEASRVHVYVTLDLPITLRHGYKIDVVDASMLGGKNLKIYEGPENAEELGGNITILGSQPIDIIVELGAAVNGFQEMINAVSQGQGTLGKLLKDETMYNNMVTVSDDLKKVVSRVEKGESSIGRLLSDDDSVYEDLMEAMASVKNISASLEAGEGTLGLLMQDKTIYEDIQVLMANLRLVSEGRGVLGKLMSEDDQVYADLQATLEAVRSISESINEGEGTIGKLVRDAKLYDEASSLVEDIRAAVDDLREASPITSFGSVIFGAF